MAKVHRIQVTIGGYKGHGTTLIAGLDTGTGILVVMKQHKYSEKLIKSDMTMITNMDLDDADTVFTDKDIKSAVESYFTRCAQSTIVIKDEARRFTPDSKVETDTVTTTGRTYRISPDIDNGQMAVLALCAFVDKQKGVGGTIEALNELDSMYRILSI